MQRNEILSTLVDPENAENMTSLAIVATHTAENEPLKNFNYMGDSLNLLVPYKKKFNPSPQGAYAEKRPRRGFRSGLSDLLPRGLPALRGGIRQGRMRRVVEISAPSLAQSGAPTPTSAIQD